MPANTPKLYDLIDCDGESCGIFSTTVPEKKLAAIIKNVREDDEYDSNLFMEKLNEIDPKATFVTIGKLDF